MKHTQPLIAWWLIILISFAMTLQGCSAKTPGPQGPVVTLTKIEPHEADGRTEITVEGTGPILQYTSFQLTEPLRLVVDIADAEVGNFKNKIEMKSGAITDITPAQKDNIARLEIGLSQAVDTKVYQADGKLMIEVAKPGEEAKPATETAVPAQPQEAPIPEQVGATEVYPAATVVSSVKATAGKKGVRVVITGDGALLAKILKLGGNRIAINIPGTKSKVRQKLVPVRKGGLLRVRVGQHTDKVSVVLDLSKPMDYTVTPEGKTLVIVLGPAGVRKEEKAPQELAAAQEPPIPVIGKETAAPTEPVVASQETATAPPAEKEMPQEAAPAVSPSVKNERPAAAKPVTGIAANALLANGSRYSGRKISLDLQDADLVNVMRLFAEVANLNIILSPDVKGKVTVRMVNIPWDQAMEIILKMNSLGFILDDNILRIASVGALTKEADDELRSKEAKKKAEDLITRIIPINYATAAGVEPTIKKSLSPRGDTVVDVRTNTLIVKDIARAVDDVVALVKILDKPIAQIMIEARIVEASLTFSRQLGVQWGATGSFDASHGNPTGLTFPNSVGITGGPTMGTTPSGNGNFLVNNPAPAGASTGGGAIGFQFGSISKALNLDLVLSALESTGEGKVISSPRVSALDNKEAKIEQGLSIPFSTTSSSGTQIQFIDAKLALTVTPHATPDNRIFLKIQATKNAPDTSITGASGQPSIRKNEATTEILLADGETAVIGGILTVNRSTSYTKVPFFGDLPFVGWLFSSKTTKEDKGELLIFITPRIVRQEVL